MFVCQGLIYTNRPANLHENHPNHTPTPPSQSLTRTSPLSPDVHENHPNETPASAGCPTRPAPARPPLAPLLLRLIDNASVMARNRPMAIAPAGEKERRCKNWEITNAASATVASPKMRSRPPSRMSLGSP